VSAAIAETLANAKAIAWATLDLGRSAVWKAAAYVHSAADNARAALNLYGAEYPEPAELDPVGNEALVDAVMGSDFDPTSTPAARTDYDKIFWLHLYRNRIDPVYGTQFGADRGDSKVADTRSALQIREGLLRPAVEEFLDDAYPSTRTLQPQASFWQTVSSYAYAVGAWIGGAYNSVWGFLDTTVESAWNAAAETLSGEYYVVSEHHAESTNQHLTRMISDSGNAPSGNTSLQSIIGAVDFNSIIQQVGPKYNSPWKLAEAYDQFQWGVVKGFVSGFMDYVHLASASAKLASSSAKFAFNHVREMSWHDRLNPKAYIAKQVFRAGRRAGEWAGRWIGENVTDDNIKQSRQIFGLIYYSLKELESNSFYGARPITDGVPDAFLGPLAPPGTVGALKISAEWFAEKPSDAQVRQVLQVVQKVAPTIVELSLVLAGESGPEAAGYIFGMISYEVVEGAAIGAATTGVGVVAVKSAKMPLLMGKIVAKGQDLVKAGQMSAKTLSRLQEFAKHVGTFIKNADGVLDAKALDELLESARKIFRADALKGIEFPGFRVGDSITKALPDGSYPRWFAKEAAEKANTIQGRYWMNRAAAAAPGEFTPRQLAKMRAGFAPQVKIRVRNRATGEIEMRTVSKELHHNLGNRGTWPFDEPLHLREIWPWQHELIDELRHTGYDFLGIID